MLELLTGPGGYRAREQNSFYFPSFILWGRGFVTCGDVTPLLSFQALSRFVWLQQGAYDMASPYCHFLGA
ncbi:hypothetical protein Pdw03_6511 [Penicillium digitatum]|uniref:Uncharacterized protein n=1 Tax=Penicillium digitatum TaxID=36651 RepID=A0A7T6XK23_PENDI|nr:hypothetical protein Pdw03_6511 [Penicillium digitatum]